MSAVSKTVATNTNAVQTSTLLPSDTPMQALSKTMELWKSGSLASAIERFLAEGPRSTEDRQRLRDLVHAQDLSIPDNPQLDAQLGAMRRRGTASKEELLHALETAGKLSEREQDALGSTLVSLALAGGVRPADLAEIGSMVAAGGADRLGFIDAQKTGAEKRQGLLFALTTAATIAIVAGAHMIGAEGIATKAVEIGMMFGVGWLTVGGMHRAAERRGQAIADYGKTD